LGEGREDRGALVALDDGYRNAFRQSGDGEPGMLHDRGVVGDGVEPEDEGLILRDLLLRRRIRAQDGRTAGREGERPGGDRLARERRESRAHAEGAAHPSGQIAREVVHPRAWIEPAAVAGLGALDVERRGRPRVAERDDGGREARAHLAHLRDRPLRAEPVDAGRSGRRAGQRGQQYEDEARGAHRAVLYQKTGWIAFNRSSAAAMSASSARSSAASYVPEKRRSAPASSHGTVTIECSGIRCWLAASAFSNGRPLAVPRGAGT